MVRVWCTFYGNKWNYIWILFKYQWIYRVYIQWWSFKSYRVLCIQHWGKNMKFALRKRFVKCLNGFCQEFVIRILFFNLTKGFVFNLIWMNIIWSIIKKISKNKGLLRGYVNLLKACKRDVISQFYKIFSVLYFQKHLWHTLNMVLWTVVALQKNVYITYWRTSFWQTYYKKLTNFWDIKEKYLFDQLLTKMEYTRKWSI